MLLIVTVEEVVVAEVPTDDEGAVGDGVGLGEGRFNRGGGIGGGDIEIVDVRTGD